MHKSYNKTQIFILIVIFCFSWAGMASFFSYNRSSKEVLHLKKENQVINTIYQSTLEMFRLSAHPIFEGVVHRDQVLEVFAKGINSQGREQDAARNELYSLLKPAYDKLRGQGFVLFQFHTPEINSFLRFNRPDEYGDSLKEIRPSIQIANVEKRIVEGFEFGHINSGYRNVFPLSYNNRHIGSVELSISFDKIRERMDQIDRLRHYQLVLSKEAVFSALFEQWKENYPTSPLHKDYVLDSSLSPEKLQQSITDEDLQLMKTLSIDPDVQTKMRLNMSFTITEHTDSADWVVTFIPVKDTRGIDSGYLVAYEPDPFITSLKRSFVRSTIFGTILLLIIFGTAWNLILANRKLKSEKNHLSTINDTIGDGLYVMDNQGIITHVNKSFTDVLGYEAREILGKVGHDIFHVHENHEVNHCPIYIALESEQGFKGEELFRHKSGKLIPVEATSKSFSYISGRKFSVCAFRDITERKKYLKKIEAQKEALQKLADTDALTGIYNRKKFDQELYKHTQLVNRNAESSLGLIMFDLDHFKLVNDTYGHDVGDQVLITITKIVKSNIRVTDIFARWGGEEFMLLVPGADTEQLTETAEKLRNLIKRQNFSPADQITVSFGMTVFRPEEATTQFMKRVDNALYQAKENGRDCIYLI